MEFKETGDYGILEEQVPFDCKKGSAVPLFEHLDKSFHYTVTHLGPHKLPLIGRADWNDCLNLNCFSSEPGESFQTTGPSEGPVAESVFIAGMFVKYGKEFEELCRRTGHEELAAEAEKAVDEMMLRTSTTEAPWHIIEANSKLYARIKVLEIVVEALEKRLE